MSVVQSTSPAMKHKNQCQGKVYRFAPRTDWDEDARSDANVPKIVVSHMAVIVGRSDNRRGWVKVAPVWAWLSFNI